MASPQARAGGQGGPRRNLPPPPPPQIYISSFKWKRSYLFYLNNSILTLGGLDTWAFIGPCGPSQQVGPTLKLLKTIDMLPKKTGSFMKPEKLLPLYESYSPNHFGTPCDVIDPIQDFEKKIGSPLSVSTLASMSVKCDSTGSRMCGHDHDQ
jgi:hypothetical protein